MTIPLVGQPLLVMHKGEWRAAITIGSAPLIARVLIPQSQDVEVMVVLEWQPEMELVPDGAWRWPTR